MNSFRETNYPFIIRLIDELKKHEFISSGIMLPLVIGAYKVKENFQGDNYLEFIEHVYNDIIESLYTSGRHLYFRECEASRNFVLEPVDKRPEQYNITICYRGNAVIYCNDAILGEKREIEATNLRTYFLNKLLKQTVKYCNFIDTDPNTSENKEWMCQLNNKKDVLNEISIIQSIIQ